jgi:hypothetical protein
MVDPSARIDPNAVPAEIDRWNWGAFLLNWIWGIGNNTFIALLTLVPFFGTVIMPFVLGAKGSKWAWRNGRWDSVEHFKRVQRSWAIWGAVIWVGVILLYAGFFGSFFYLLGHSEAYRLGVAKLEVSPEAADALGKPISCGFPVGAISVVGPSGRATLSFSAIGSKAAGRVFLVATKQNGVWSLKRLILKVNGTDEEINLLHQITAAGAVFRDGIFPSLFFAAQARMMSPMVANL